MLVKSLTDVFVISLRIKTGSQRGHKQLVMTTGFFCRKERIPSDSLRRLNVRNIFTPAIVVLVLLAVIGCSGINEQIGPDQWMQRSLDAHKEAARLHEEQHDWANYAEAQHNL